MTFKKLTKSRFKTGHECPSKLYFIQHEEYPSLKEEDSFLEALAEGGFQVGELAKFYYPGGIDIDTLDKEQALKRTRDALQKDRVVIFEAAVEWGPFFIRVDILEKIGHVFRIIEVKSKTFDPDQVREQGFFTKNKAGIDSTWEPYIQDVAFQAFVLKNAFSVSFVAAKLMLLDKTTQATVDGLNQRFIIMPDGHHYRIKIREGTNPESLGEKILKEISVDEEIKFVWDQTYHKGLSFEKYAHWLAEIYAKDEYDIPTVGRKCKDCEYRIPDEMKTTGKKSGFDFCFSKALNLSGDSLKGPFVFDVRNNWRVSDKLFPKRAIFAKELTEEDLRPKKPTQSQRGGWSESDRKVLQVEFLKNPNKKLEVLIEPLKSEIEGWEYPYHFIDFETLRTAIPFNKGRKPYEQLAFQFSHHRVTKDQKITHQNQYLFFEKGRFPNFDFLRALKKAVGKEGTVFRYHNHENTVLLDIERQIKASHEEIPDAHELLEFIESLTIVKDKNSKVIREGPRSMVDLCRTVEQFYFHRDMGGRTSIKKVLPAILNDSEYLQNRYSKSFNELGISSQALGNFILIKKDKLGNVIDPYSRLEPVFDDFSLALDAEEDGIKIDGELKDGGAAMMAYARMQFSEITEAQRESYRAALLRYCELDTLAMVMIWEYWVNDLLLRRAQS